MSTVVQTKHKRIKLTNGGWAKIRTKLPMSVQYKAATEAKEKHPENAEYMAGIFMLAGLILEWDLVDENKKPIPINAETIDAYLVDADTYKILDQIETSGKLTAEKKSK